MKEHKIEISLKKDEAIVLFEFLSRFSRTDLLQIEHQAEERALWDLTCSLEKKLSEPFSGDYSKILKSARERLKDNT